MNGSKKLVIFDLDNTLLECGQFYIDAENTFVEALHKRTKLDKKLVRDILNSIDVRCSELSDGFLATRYPRSFQAASLALEAIAGMQPDILFAQDMHKVGESVFDAPYPLYPGVPELLDRLITEGWDLAIVSKGQEDIQLKKIMINFLDIFFQRKNVHIVLKKTPELFATIAENYPVCWVVGDSLRDDIGPAQKAGLKTIHIASKTGHWGYENTENVPDYTVHSVTEIVPIISYQKNSSNVIAHSA